MQHAGNYPVRLIARRDFAVHPFLHQIPNPRRYFGTTSHTAHRKGMGYYPTFERKSTLFLGGWDYRMVGCCGSAETGRFERSPNGLSGLRYIRQATGRVPRAPRNGFTTLYLGTWHRRCREDGLAPLLVGQRSHRKPAPQTSVRPSHKKSGTDFRPCLTSKWRFGPHTPNHHGWRAICALPPIPARIFGS